MMIRNVLFCFACLVGFACQAQTAVPSVGLQLISPTLTEDGRQRGGFEVRVMNPGQSSVTVMLQFSGSATPGVDFQPPPQSVVLSADQPVASIELIPIDDTLGEPDESLMVRIAPSPNYEVVGGAITLTIRDDDLSPDEIISRLLDNNPDPLTRAVVAAFADLCRPDNPDRGPGLAMRCQAFRRALRNPGQIDNIRDAVRWASADEAGSQGRGVTDLAKASLGNIAARLSALRAGASGGSLAGLNWHQDGDVLALNEVLSALQANDSGTNDTLSGGLLESSRLGIFINGTISNGDRERTDLEPGFDFDTQGITAGVDYRFGEQWFGGVALTASDFSSDFLVQNASIETRSLIGTLYASRFGDNWFVDASLGAGEVDFDASRLVDYTLTDADDDFVVRERLGADNQADLLTFDLGAGWDWFAGPWDFGPRAGVQYLDADIEGYTEFALEGDGFFAVQVDEQNVESLLVSLGGSAGRNWSMSWGVLRVQLDATFFRELEDEARAVRSRFVNAPGSNPFVIPTESADESYGELGLSLNAVLAGGNQVFVSYQRLFAANRLDINSLNLGVRFEF